MIRTCTSCAAVAVLALSCSTVSATVSRAQSGVATSNGATPDARQSEARTGVSVAQETVELARQGAERLIGYIVRPAGHGDGPHPAIIALHGCGGPINKRGQLSSRHADWANRWAMAGYVVLFPDSFNSRGIREVCTIKAGARPVTVMDRVSDVVAAADWLADKSFVDPKRIALIGWSNGGTTLLNAMRTGSPLTRGRFTAAIAFYPGCRVPGREAARGRFRLAMPVTILIGTADNWTEPEHCRKLAGNDQNVRVVEYAGAVHGFDAPASRQRVRRDTGYAGKRGVRVGTDPKARAQAIELTSQILARSFAGR